MPVHPPNNFFSRCGDTLYGADQVLTHRDRGLVILFTIPTSINYR